MNTNESPVVARDLIAAMVAIIRNPSIGDSTARLAATVIATDANFNERVSRSKERGMAQDRLFQIVDQADELLMECNELADALSKPFDEEFIKARLSAIIAGFSSIDV